MLTRLKSTLSTVTSTLQAVRELPGAIKEVVELSRKNHIALDENEKLNAALKGMNDLYSERCDAHVSEKKSMWDAATKVAKEREDLCAKLATVLHELGWNKPEPPEPGRIRREMDGLFEELAVEKYVWRMQWDWAKERITALTSDANELARALESSRRDCQQKLDLQWDAAKAMESDRDEALAKLARYEAAEKWRQVTPGINGGYPPDDLTVLFEYNHPDYTAHRGLEFGRPGTAGTYRWRFLSSKDVPC